MKHATEQVRLTSGHTDHPNPRMRQGGDLFIKPLTRSEMLAPLKWHERQMAVCARYGERADGTIGVETVSRWPHQKGIVSP
jgi:hypothetical protein